MQQSAQQLTYTQSSSVPAKSPPGQSISCDCDSSTAEKGRGDYVSQLDAQYMHFDVSAETTRRNFPCKTVIKKGLIPYIRNLRSNVGTLPTTPIYKSPHHHSKEFNSQEHILYMSISVATCGCQFFSTWEHCQFEKEKMDKNLLSNISNYYLSTRLKLESKVLGALYRDVHFSAKG